jgi:hypothetical protein
LLRAVHVGVYLAAGLACTAQVWHVLAVHVPGAHGQLAAPNLAGLFAHGFLTCCAAAAALLLARVWTLSLCMVTRTSWSAWRRFATSKQVGRGCVVVGWTRAVQLAG